MPTSYSMNGKYIPYVILLMSVILGMLFLMLGIAVSPNPESIFLTFLLIGLLAVIVIVAVWTQKMTYKYNRPKDHSLRKR